MLTFIKLYSYGYMWVIHYISVVRSFFNPKNSLNIKVSVTKNFNDAVTSTNVDQYWNAHTVDNLNYETPWESSKYNDFVSWKYPLFSQMMESGISVDGKIVLDYGCGTGNDLVTFITKFKPSKLIGVDISAKALELTSSRISLHDTTNIDIQLIKIGDSDNKLPFPNEYFDFINCAGVLMHVSNPTRVLGELYRVLKKGGCGKIMVYSKNSIWYHLYVPYVLQILKNRLTNLDADNAFSHSTDGENCPQARSYKPDGFLNLLQQVGFQAEFIGGYFGLYELMYYKKYLNQALSCDALGNEHKDFLKKLQNDGKKIPKYEGFYAGHAGVYNISKML